MPIQTKKLEISRCEEFKNKNIKIEILSIRVEYDRNLLPMKTIAKPFDFFDRSTQIDPKSVTWYFGKIKSDLADEGNKSLFSLPHWLIKTNNIEIFNFMNKSYNSIDLIFGQDKAYWRFTYKEGLQDIEMIEGDIQLNVGTCSCCIDTQYLRVIDDLRKQYQKS